MPVTKCDDKTSSFVQRQNKSPNHRPPIARSHTIIARSPPELVTSKVFYYYQISIVAHRQFIYKNAASMHSSHTHRVSAARDAGIERMSLMAATVCTVVIYRWCSESRRLKTAWDDHLKQRKKRGK